MSGHFSFDLDPANWWDVSVNRVWGCDPISPACDNCYAMAFDRYAGGSLAGHLAGSPGSRKGETHFGPGKSRLPIPSFREKCLRLNVQAERLGIRYRVFPNSMGDWLDPKWEAAWLADFIGTIAECKAIDFLTLTKRPGLWKKRLKAAHAASSDPKVRRGIAWWLDGGEPMNVWAGTTVENQEMADLRIPQILRIGAGVHWLSMEPLLSEVNLTLVGVAEELQFNCLGSAGGIGWVAVGGESGSRKKVRPSDPAWIHSIVEQCHQSAVPVWFKQWGEWVGGKLHRAKGKVILEDGGIFWTNPGHTKLHRWGPTEHPSFDRVSALVGMKPRALPTWGGEPGRSDNGLIGGRILREMPQWLDRDGRAPKGIQLGHASRP